MPTFIDAVDGCHGLDLFLANARTHLSAAAARMRAVADIVEGMGKDSPFVDVPPVREPVESCQTQLTAKVVEIEGELEALADSIDTIETLAMSCLNPARDGVSPNDDVD